MPDGGAASSRRGATRNPAPLMPEGLACRAPRAREQLLSGWSSLENRR
jgi:hypothetical protein